MRLAEGVLPRQLEVPQWPSRLLPGNGKQWPLQDVDPAAAAAGWQQAQQCRPWHPAPVHLDILSAWGCRGQETTGGLIEPGSKASSRSQHGKTVVARTRLNRPAAWPRVRREAQTWRRREYEVAIGSIRDADLQQRPLGRGAKLWWSHVAAGTDRQGADGRGTKDRCPRQRCLRNRPLPRRCPDREHQREMPLLFQLKLNAQVGGTLKMRGQTVDRRARAVINDRRPSCAVYFKPAARAFEFDQRKPPPI